MLRHESSMPLYMQVKGSLTSKISSGSIRPHEKLPSERELCDLYNVSRLTIRQALNELKNEGLVYSAHGKGNYVSSTPIRQGLTTIVDFENAVQSGGFEPGTKVLRYSQARHSAAARFLSLDVDEVLHCTELLGYGDGKPVAHYLSFSTEETGRGIPEVVGELENSGKAFTTREIYDRMGVRLGRAVQTLGAVNADSGLSRSLNVVKGAALFRIVSEAFQTDGSPVEYRVAHYRADWYSFVVEREYS